MDNPFLDSASVPTATEPDNPFLDDTEAGDLEKKARLNEFVSRELDPKRQRQAIDYSLKNDVPAMAAYHSKEPLGPRRNWADTDTSVTALMADHIYAPAIKDEIPILDKVAKELKLLPLYLPEFAMSLPEGAVSFSGTVLKGSAAEGLVAPNAFEDVVQGIRGKAGMGPLEFEKWKVRAAGSLNNNPKVWNALNRLEGGSWTAEEAERYLRENVEPNLDTRDPRQSDLFKRGQAVQDYAARTFAGTPEFREGWTRKIGAGVGSSIPFFATALTGPFSLPLGTVLGTAASSGEALERAIQKGATREQMITASKMGLMPGASEQLPFEVLFNKVPVKALRPLGRAVAKISKQIIAEGGQEAFVQFWQNAISQYVYDPEQDLGEGLLEAWLIGGAVGSIYGSGGTAIEAVVNRGSKSDRAEQAAERLREIGKEAKKSQALKKLPQIGPMIADGKGNLSATQDAVISLFQEAGIPADQVEAQYPSIAARLDESDQTGVDIDLDDADLLQLGQLDGFDAFTDHVRVGTGATASEARTEVDEAVAQMGGTEQEAGVREIIERQLLQFQNPAEAAINAQSLASKIETAAARSGKVTAQELLARYGLEIASSALEAEKIGPVLDMIRKGDTKGLEVMTGSERVQSTLQAAGLTPEMVRNLTNEQVVQEVTQRSMAQITPPQTPEFERWHGKSQEKRVMYHGTIESFSTFNPEEFGDNTRGFTAFVSPDPKFTEPFAGKFSNAGSEQAREYHGFSLEEWVALPVEEVISLINDAPGRFSTGGNIMPVWVNAENPFDYENPEHVAAVVDAAVDGGYSFFGQELASGDWAIIERNHNLIKSAGFDSAYMLETGTKNLGLFYRDQLKSATGNRGTFDPSDPSILFQGGDLTETPEFKAWAGTEEPVIEPEEVNQFDFRGQGPFVMRAYHGTTHDFDRFDASVKGQKEAQFGAVNYFTSSEYDADENYAGEGPDLTSRIVRRAETLIDYVNERFGEESREEIINSLPITPEKLQDVRDGVADMDDYDTAYAVAHELARIELTGSGDRVLELYVKTEKPFVVDEVQPVFAEFIDYEEIRNEAISEVAAQKSITPEEAQTEAHEDDVQEMIWEIESDKENPLFTAIDNVAARSGMDGQKLWGEISDYVLDGISHARLEKFLRDSEALAYAEDPETGDLVGYHLLGEIIEELGFDSIVLKNAEARFSNMGIPPDTAHVHVFDSHNTNIKSVDNLGAFDPKDPRILYQEPFYSGVLAAVDAFRQPKASGEQWLGMIRNAPGIKKEELEWLGVEDWLKGQKSVTKQDLQDFVAANQIKVKEVVKGEVSEVDIFVDSEFTEDAPDNEFFETEAEELHLEEAVAELAEQQNIEEADVDGAEAKDRAIELARERYEPVQFYKHATVSVGDQEIGFTVNLNNDDNTINIWATDINGGESIYGGPALDDPQIEAEIRDAAAKHLGIDLDDQETKFETYTLPGGTNYREVLLTLPDAGSKMREYEQRLDQIKLKHGKPPSASGFANWATPEETAELHRLAEAVGEGDKDFKSGHFSEPNIVAHVRLKDRVDADGKKVLFIEEIQSDWHQAGREKGYGKKTIYERYLSGGLVGQHETREEAEEFKARSPNADIKIIEREVSTGIPEAPFKTSWPELAFKRALRMAVEEGYDKIAWTPGDVQADRYDLAEHVENVRVLRGRSGNQIVVRGKDGQTVLNGDFNEDGVMQSGRAGGQPLDAVLGKDLAEKIMAVPKSEVGFNTLNTKSGNVGPVFETQGEADEYVQGLPENTRANVRVQKFHGANVKTFEGLDLKIGGEGMKAFYDKMLPKTVGKLVKKWSGKVGSAQIPVSYEVFDSSGPLAIHVTEVQAQKHAMNENSLNLGSTVKYRPVRKEVHSVEITPEMEQAVMEGLPLFQEPGGPKGFLTFSEARDKFKMTLTGEADLSTFLHESAHFVLEMMQDMGERGEASEQQVRDLTTLRKWMKLETGQKIGRKEHEQFARMVEAYYQEGKAPSSELREVFIAFKSWLVFIYKKLLAADVNLTDEIRSVMDRMVATDEAISMARAELGFPEQPASQEDLALNDEEYASYVGAWTKARDAQQQATDAKLLLEAVKQRRKAWKDEREKIVSAKQADLEKTKGWDTWQKLKDTPVASDSVPKDLKKLAQGLTRKEGLELELVAETLGYTSGEHMLREVAATRRSSRDIPELAEMEMVDRHGFMTDTQLTEGARKEVHNDETQEMLFTEFRAFAEQAAIKVYPGLSKLLRGQAEEKVAQMTMQELNPTKWRRAELKASAESASAAAKGDKMEAALAKRRQMVAAAMYRAVVQGQETIGKYKTFLGPFVTNKKRAQLGKAGQMYLDGVDEILEAIEFKDVSYSELAERKRLQEIVAQAEADEEILDIPEHLLGANIKNYREMTVEELRGVHDAVQQLWTLARFKNKLRVKKEVRDRDKVLGDMKANSERLKDVRNTSKFVRGKLDKIVDGVRWYTSQLQKMEFLFAYLDGEASGGPVYEVMFQPFVDARHEERKILKRFHETIWKRLRKLPKAQMRKLNEKFHFMGQEMTGQNILMAAMNVGNESSRQKLARGYGWSEQQMMDELDRWMSKEDWELVQHVWDEVNTLWPMLSDTAFKANGLRPDKVEPMTVETRHGDFKGGYFPVVYDPKQNHEIRKYEQSKHKSKDLWASNFLSPKAKTGVIHKRTTAAYPILLDMSVLSRHIGEVVHYVTHYDAVMQADKLSRDPRFREVVEEKLGPEYYNKIRPWLQNIANNAATRTVDQFGEWLGVQARTGFSVARMGFNVSTALKQQLGHFTSMTKIPVKFYAQAYTMVTFDIGNLRKNWRFALDNSKELERLIEEFDRDIARMHKIWAEKTTQKFHGHIIRHAFKPIAFAQLQVNVTAWWGAFLHRKDQGYTDKQSFTYADAITRQTQSAAGLADLSPIQYSGELGRAVSMFYTFASVLWNIQAEALRENKSKRDLPKLFKKTLFLIMVPVTAEALTRQIWNAAFEGDDEWDDMPFAVQWAADAVSYSLMGMPGIRDVAGWWRYQPRLTPYGKLPDEIARSTKALYDMALKGDAPTRSEMRGVVSAISTVTKTPASAPYNLLDEMLGED